MVDTKREAANSNKSFFELVNNPKKLLLEDGLYSCIQLCRAANISRSMIAEALFKFAMREVIPRGEYTNAKSNIYYAQLLRFRDKIDAMITEIETPPK